MRVLSIDSSSSSATCAILEDDKLLGEISFNDKKQHSVILMPQVDSLLENLNLDLKDIDAFAISSGPGSFTGLRIGMATVKGLAHGLNKPFVGISTLDCLAYNMAYTSGIICPIMDALRDNVYTALYRFNNSKLEKITDYLAVHIDELIAIIKENAPNEVCFIGDGTYKFRQKLSNSLSNTSFAPAHLNLARASSLGELALTKLKAGEVEDLLTFSPIYLRKSQAEREYDAKMELAKNE